MRPTAFDNHDAVASPPSAEFLRIASVVRTGLGRSTIYRLIAEHKFPTPVRLAGRAVGWRRTGSGQVEHSPPHLLALTILQSKAEPGDSLAAVAAGDRLAVNARS